MDFSKVAGNRLIARFTAAVVIISAMIMLVVDIQTPHFHIENSPKEILIFLLGGSISFLWNPCKD